MLFRPSLDEIKTVAEIVAYMSAAGFFLWRVIAGFFVVNAAIDVKTVRSRADDKTDFLVIAALIKKGGTGALVLHDVRARISYDDQSEELELIGYERLSFKPEDNGVLRTRVVFDTRSTASPLLMLTPEEQATFSAFTRVPKSSPCIVEVAVSGKRANHRRIGQWRSSVVSLPTSVPVEPTEWCG